ncbi:hypothetical protein [Bacillus sinesaloumensis]|uniref:hypothetical protein n=1 Tax=Litchfieldia sinesaloumensis TaxID=1926280 RepID=UPI0009886F68|nr:hypothetical protein [Bacillus sinesaloumensis]
MAEGILYFIFMIPVLGILIWTYFEPEESMLFGQRWMFRDEPEFSNLAIRYTKFTSIVGIYLITMILLFYFVSCFIIRIVLVIGFIAYVLIGGLKLLKMYSES